jgi:CheY-like chemotaxis protein
MPPDILVVDDNHPITELLAEVLTDAGYPVRIAYNGMEALAAVKEHIPALILLDCMLPGITGRDVVRALRAQGFASLPVIMMSAAEPAEPSLQAGATDFLPKPFFLDDLLDCISSYVGDTLPCGS